MTPGWKPVLGNYSAISQCSNRLWNVPFYVALNHEYFTDEATGWVAPIVGINTPYSNHLAINCPHVVE